MKLEGVVDKEIAGKFQVIGKTTDCDGKLNMSSKQRTVCSSNSSAQVVRKFANEKLIKINSKSNNCNQITRSTEIISKKKVTENLLVNIKNTVINETKSKI
jgi:transcription initiation factor IIE alpha subunit